MVDSERYLVIEFIQSHPRDPETDATARAILRSHDGPFCSCRPDGHVTASAVVLSETMQRTLVVWHKRLKRWLQPGGHCEPSDQTVFEASRRECREETGLTELRPISPQPIDWDLHWIPESDRSAGHWHLDVRFGFIANQQERLAEGCRWAAIDELAPMDLGSVARAVAEGVRIAALQQGRS